MAKRRLTNPWASAALQRSMTALTRSAWQTGSRIVNQAVKSAIKSSAPKPGPRKKASRPAAALLPKPTPVRRAAAPAKALAKTPTTARGELPGSWSRGVALGPAGARAYHLYRPPGLTRNTPAPLLVMLHGCGQTAQTFALSTRMNRLAAREGFCVLYPEQDRRAHPQGCWNWYSTRTHAAQAEAATLLLAIDQVAFRCPVDLGRVAVAGLSAGAGMAALLASRYPTRFRAVVMHSGVPPGVAQSTASALGAMLGTRRARPAAERAGEPAWPPLLVIHGNADSIVAAANGRAAAAMWAASAGAKGAQPRVLRRGQRHPMTVTDYKLRGRTMAKLCEVDGLAHAWSGGAASQSHGDARGPDASAMVWAFAAKQFATPLPAVAGA